MSYVRQHVLNNVLMCFALELSIPIGDNVPLKAAAGTGPHHVAPLGAEHSSGKPVRFHPICAIYSYSGVLRKPKKLPIGDVLAMALPNHGQGCGKKEKKRS